MDDYEKHLEPYHEIYAHYYETEEYFSNSHFDGKYDDFLYDLNSRERLELWVEQTRMTVTSIDDISNLERLSFFVGANNSGKTFTLNKIHNILNNVEENASQISFFPEKTPVGDTAPFCFLIPKNRSLGNPKGRRIGFLDALKWIVDLLNNNHDLQDGMQIESLIQIIEVLANPTDKENPATLRQMVIESFKEIALRWKQAIYTFFPDIKFDHELSDREIEVSYKGNDSFVDGVSYSSWFDLGSGHSTLVSSWEYIALHAFPSFTGYVDYLFMDERLTFFDDVQFLLETSGV
ncbi:MAG TPA: hypothetical protein VKM55_22165, partial [Candidatus Lokiarchaeia archaeon]|nr:hypothetical protein [Candidatus Lokiarchaeia archaeon]